MRRTLILYVIRALAGVLCLSAGWLVTDLAALLLSIHSLALGLYQIRNLESIHIFNNSPGFFTDFAVGFNLLFPAALMALWLARLTDF
jgi:hypothetical protein